MRYSAEHKAQTREKLLDASGSLAKCGGFASTGVDGLMKAIGLTGGAFYGHFSSKDELFAAIVERELSRSAERLGSSDASRDKLQRCLTMYLNMKHVQQPAAGCAIPALGAGAGRRAAGLGHPRPVRRRAGAGADDGQPGAPGRGAGIQSSIDRLQPGPELVPK